MDGLTGRLININFLTKIDHSTILFIHVGRMYILIITNFPI